jgi:hypothetical protein
MDENIKLLNSVFKSTLTASKKLGAILPSIENKSLRRDIISQMSEYDRINKSVGDELCFFGEKPKSKLSLKDKVSVLGTGIEISTNPSCEHAAQMIAQTSGNGALGITGIMNSCVNSTPRIYDLARKYVACEERGIERMKPYL